MNQLDQLKQFTTVVADTGDFGSLEAYKPQDATTNPTLILKAVQQERYAPLLGKAVKEARAADRPGADFAASVMDHLLVLFGKEILKIVPGRVSTELDARLSFDTDGCVALARKLIALYEKEGISRERVLIKIASTWEGLQAAKALEQEGIHCNLTLMFSLAQAVVAAENRCTLISPFVGRILDWFKANHKRDYTGAEDPGVLSVHEIYHYFKKFGYRTQVMGASFRNLDEIRELAGCDLLTISPDLLEGLRQSQEPLSRRLSPDQSRDKDIQRLSLDEKGFRWMMNEDAMATDRLADGIRRFAADANKVNDLIAKEIG